MQLDTTAHSDPTIAVCGTGSIGFRHLRVIRERLHGRAVGVPIRSSRHDELRQSGYEAYARIANAAQAGCRMAIIATDTNRHLRDAHEAILAGCDLLIEKPIAPGINGLQELWTAADHSGCRIWVGCNLRFNTGLQLFRRRLPEIGQIHGVHIECQSYLPDWRPNRDYRCSYSSRADDGGVLRDLIHEIDYAVWLFGRPQSVFAMLLNLGRLSIEAEETVDLFWQAKAGYGVSIHLDYLNRIPRRSIRAQGDRGDIEWDFVRQRLVVALASKESEEIPMLQDRDDMMADQTAAFVQAIRTGISGDLATFDEGAFAVALCEAARHSAASGAAETIPDWRLSS
jgi:predicted dehydrogenase